MRDEKEEEEEEEEEEVEVQGRRWRSFLKGRRKGR